MCDGHRSAEARGTEKSRWESTSSYGNFNNLRGKLRACSDPYKIFTGGSELLGVGSDADLVDPTSGFLRRSTRESHDVSPAKLSVCTFLQDRRAPHCRKSIFGSEPDSYEGRSGPILLAKRQKPLRFSASLFFFTHLLLSLLRNVTSANGLENGPARQRHCRPFIRM